MFSVAGIPLLLILVWVWVMEVHHEAYCWKNYGKSEYIWIIVGPMVLALVVSPFVIAAAYMRKKTGLL